MSDYDRDPGPTREHVTERTTVVTSDGGRRGGGGWIVAVVLLIALLVVLFLVFGKGLTGAADEVGVNVNIDAPKVDIPDNVKVEVPEEIKIDTNTAN